jgi:coenzyme PQQ biosynthesis protein PqqD
MDLNKTVRLQPDYLLERIDNEITVYHPTLTTSFFLNETGALIWALCDGTRSVAEIIRSLGDLYPESREQIATDVTDLVTALVTRDIAELA